MITEALNNDSWAIMPSSLDNISCKVIAGVSDPVLNDEITEGTDGASYIESKAAFMSQFEEQLRVDQDGCGYISINGPMMLNPGPYERMVIGAADMGRIADLVRVAAGEDEINSLVIEINSPGGTVVGTPELAGAIREFNSTGKKSVAFTNSLMASAAYWVGSQCSEVVCTESAIVGSVGVIRAHVDLTEARAQAGVKVEVFRGGDNKVAGAYSTEINEGQRELIQRGIDDKHAEFQDVVRSTRNVDLAMLDGRTFYGKQAAEYGFADAVVSSFAGVAPLVKSDDYMAEESNSSSNEVDNSRKDMSNPAENNESAPEAEIADGEVAISEAVATEQAEEFASTENTSDVSEEVSEEVSVEEPKEESEEVSDVSEEVSAEESEEVSDVSEESAEESDVSEEESEVALEDSAEGTEGREDCDKDIESKEDESGGDEPKEASLESRVDDLARKLEALIATLNPEKDEEASEEEASEEASEEPVEEPVEEPSFEERVEEAAEAKAAKIAADSGVDSISATADQEDSSKYANFTDAELWVQHSKIRNEEGEVAARAFYVSQIRSK